MWCQVGFDDEGRTTEVFQHFQSGTLSTDVHQWFEEQFDGFSVGEAHGQGGIDRAIRQMQLRRATAEFCEACGGIPDESQWETGHERGCSLDGLIVCALHHVCDQGGNDA
mgnify:CR=1 FL=1